MFTGGIGLMDSLHTTKCAAEPGMKICKIGGPAYPVGLEEAGASSRIADSVIRTTILMLCNVPIQKWSSV